MNDNKIVEMKHRTIISIIWSAAGKGSTTITSVVVFIVLARLLSPAEFGTFAAALVFVEVTRIIANAGWMDAIIRDPNPDDDMLSTAFWANMAIAVAVGLVVVVGAAPFGGLIRQPQVIPLLWALAPLVPVSCLGTVHVGKALHGFGYKGLATRTVIVNILSGGAAVAAAAAGWGVWSLFVQAAVSDVGNTLVAWYLSPWMPKWRFSVARFQALVRFTTAMAGTQIVWFLIARVPDLFISRYLGIGALGTYRIGFRMFELIGQVAVQPAATVGLTTFSRLAHDRGLMEKAYVKILSLLAVVVFPLMGGFGVVSYDAIPLIFGAKWTASVPVAQILMILMIPYLLSYFDGAILGAVGKSAALMRIAIFQLILTVLGAWVAAPYGLPAVAAVYVLQAYVTLIYQQYVIQKEASCHYNKLIKGLFPVFLATIAMMASVLCGTMLIHAAGGGAISRIVLGIAIGCISYPVWLRLLARSEFYACLELVMVHVLKRRPRQHLGV